jgi:hypothetical protein
MCRAKAFGSLVLLVMIIAFGNVLVAGTLELQMPQAAVINGVQIQPGECTVSWKTKGNSADVTFHQRGKKLTSVQGKVVELDKPAMHNSIIISQNAGGNPVVKEIHFQGKKTAFLFD